MKKAKEDWIGAQCEEIETCQGWSGGAMVLGKLPVPGRPTIWITVGQGPTALAVGAGGGCLDIFTLIYPFSPLSPSLWETARYRLKYCLKGPLNPKQPTNQIETCLNKNNSKREYQLVKDLTSEKQDRSSTIQDKSGKCLTEEKEILSRWTEYCSELYNYESCGDNAVLDCSQPPEEDLQPILHEEVEIAVASLKKGKSAGVDNIPAELVQAGGETMIDVLTEICNRI